MSDGRDQSDDVIDVPVESLSATALRGLVEEFVTRDGTDYGVRERELHEKVDAIMRQLQRREARIVFDRANGTANIVAAPTQGSVTISDKRPS